jgi:Ribbon-helix-helix protein, copG family.
MELKSEVMNVSPRTGRPTDCRKDHDVKVRIDDDTHKRLLKYCKEHGITKAEAIRQGIHLVLQKK